MDLKKKYEQKKKRMEELAYLLTDVKHPDFSKRADERNSISVEVEVMRQQLRGRWNPQYQCPTYKLPTNNQ